MSDTQLLIFADDWARHPSSAQHLVTELLDTHDVTWVNTIGTRSVQLTRTDILRGIGKAWQWLRPIRKTSAPQGSNPAVLSPTMYPGFRSHWQRRLNQQFVSAAVHKHFVTQPRATQRIAITTLPITADLVGQLDVDRWVYYCVDDFSVWPGLDSSVMAEMELALLGKVDTVIAASEHLLSRLTALGAKPQLLTHGIDLAHWQPRASGDIKVQWPTSDKPVALFWGLIDRRLDLSWCEQLAASGVELVLAGPQQDPWPQLGEMPGVTLAGRLDYQHLPYVAGFADVLVMPYADLPVTRAMQPLKFKEYLATGKPVVAAALPAVAEWQDAADVVSTGEQFVACVHQRIDAGLTAAQQVARQRLVNETWTQKAQQFKAILQSVPPSQMAA